MLGRALRNCVRRALIELYLHLPIFVAHFMLLMNGSLYMQFLVSFGGIGLLCAIAYIKNWSAELDKKPSHPAEASATPLQNVGPSILTRAGKLSS